MIPLPRTLAITAGEPPQGFPLWLEELAAAGVEALQVREKTLADLALFELTRRLVGLAAGRLRILVNARADLALAAGASGVHLPADALPATPLRQILPPDFLIGRSTHSPAEVAAARADGCDYALFGPVRPTPSKEGRGGLPGFEGLATAAAFGLPVFALGGIETTDDVARSAMAGAAGIAGIRIFATAAGAAAAAAAARRAWPRAGAA